MWRGAKTAALVLGILAAIPWATASAQGPPAPQPLPSPEVVPIQVTGPPAQRLNFIILGDGYQWDQQSISPADVARTLSVLGAREPSPPSRNYINIYAVKIAS